jgi:oxygen-independent coproporphyrinogen-3 oxidase
VEAVAAGEVEAALPAAPAAEEISPLSAADVYAETVILGLRLTEEGIVPRAFAARFGRDLLALYGMQIVRLLAWGLLEQLPDGRLRLTPRGRLLGNRVFMEFV